MPLNRPYIRKGVREEVEDRAPKNEEGQFLDANTNEPIQGGYDLGHKPGHEHWRESQKAEEEGLTQGEFNDRMNNPDYYQIEDPSENRSRKHEMPKEESEQKTVPEKEVAPEQEAAPEQESAPEQETAPEQESVPKQEATPEQDVAPDYDYDYGMGY